MHNDGIRRGKTGTNPAVWHKLHFTAARYGFPFDYFFKIVYTINQKAIFGQPYPENTGISARTLGRKNVFMTDVMIIGAGTAGMTAAIYAARAGLKTLIFDKSFYGGQITSATDIENYPGIDRISGVDFSQKLYEQAQALGAEFLFDPVDRLEAQSESFSAYTPNGIYTGSTVIAAPGAQRRKLNCPGEDRLTGRGVSYCATCDGAFFRGKTVAVAGGGNTALEDALFLANICSCVYLIHRRREFRAEKYLQSAVYKKHNITPLLDSFVKENSGSEQVQALTVENKQTGTQQELAVDGIFVAVGLEPDTSLFAPLAELDQNGYFVAGEDCRTRVPGLFVAGDARRKPLRQLVTAAADGAVAAAQAAEYLQK